MQQLRLLGQRQNGIHAADRLEPDEPLALFLDLEDVVQLLDDIFGRGVGQSENASRLAFHPVDIEHLRGLEERLALTARATDHQEVVIDTRPQTIRIGSKRLEHPHHRFRRNVLQRQDRHTISGPSFRLLGAIIKNRYIVASPLALGHHAIERAVADQSRAIHLEHGFENGQQLVTRTAPPVDTVTRPSTRWSKT